MIMPITSDLKITDTYTAVSDKDGNPAYFY
jgi:hypothetical protein